MQQHYELMVLVEPQAAEADPEAVLGKVRSLLRDGQAAITREEGLGTRKLAYPIKKARQGAYHLIEFDAPAASLVNLDRELKLLPEVLRHLVVVARIQTAEELEREQFIRAKIEARRRQAALAAEPKPEPKPEPERQVDRKELDEKLEKILEDDMLK